MLKGTEIALAAGDVVTFLHRWRRRLWRTASKRAAEAVTRDVAEGVISAEAAMKLYGASAAKSQPSEPMIDDDRKQRLLAAMAEAGIDMLLDLWQCLAGRLSALRHRLLHRSEGQALALVRSDGHVTLYLDSPLEVDRAEIDCPDIEVVYAPDLIADVDGASIASAISASASAPGRLMPAPARGARQGSAISPTRPRSSTGC